MGLVLHVFAKVTTWSNPRFNIKNLRKLNFFINSPAEPLDLFYSIQSENNISQFFIVKTRGRLNGFKISAFRMVADDTQNNGRCTLFCWRPAFVFLSTQRMILINQLF